MVNWERKSSYLLREIVKFRTYIDCLQTAQTQKEKIYASKATASTPLAAASEEKGTGEEKKEEGVSEGMSQEVLSA